MSIGLLFVGIAIGLLIAGSMALYKALTATPEERAARHHSLHITVDHVRIEPWALAFRDDAPLVPDLGDLAARGHDDSARVLREHGGIDFGTTEVRLHLRAHGEDEVIVREVAAAVVRSDPPFAGRLIGTGSPAPLASDVVAFDLDTQDADGVVRVVLADNPIVVRDGAPVDVLIAGITCTAYCQWRIHLETEVGEERARITVGDRDLPFETTGSEPSVFPRGFEQLA
jgi:hypothetical protein